MRFVGLMGIVLHSLPQPILFLRNSRVALAPGSYGCKETLKFLKSILNRSDAAPQLIFRSLEALLRLNFAGAPGESARAREKVVNLLEHIVLAFPEVLQRRKEESTLIALIFANVSSSWFQIHPRVDICSVACHPATQSTFLHCASLDLLNFVLHRVSLEVVASQEPNSPSLAASIFLHLCPVVYDNQQRQKVELLFGMLESSRTSGSLDSKESIGIILLLSQSQLLVNV
jgi:hypothetical protein